MRYIQRLFFLFIAVVLFSACASKQKNPEWVINETMVVNETSYQDDYGEHSGWIEIYNTTAKTVDLGGRYLTDDPDNPTKYAIPRGDILTRIKPHQHALFFADEMPSRGTFHLNFRLDPTRDNYIALYDNDGKTLLDEITIPAEMAADKTFGYKQDGKKYDDEGNTIAATVLERVTPSSNNAILIENPKIKALAEDDPNGGMLTITSMLVVFSGLILLFLAFKLSGSVAERMSQRRIARSGRLSAVRSHSQLSGEVLAAISAAIHELKEDQHDIESTILTINQVKRNFSPWNTKRQSLRELPK